MTSANTETLSDMSAASASAETQRRARQRAKGIARAYKRMDSKRALSSSKLQAPLSPIKESKPKLTSSSSHRSILSITELIDYDEGSLHDSILGDDHSECSEISFNGSFSDGSVNDEGCGGGNASNTSCQAPRMPTRGDSIRNLLAGSDENNTDNIPPELLMEDPSLATGSGKRWAAEGMKKTPSGRWTTSDHAPTSRMNCLTRQDSWASVNSFVSSSGDSVDTFVLSKATRLCWGPWQTNLHSSWVYYNNSFTTHKN